VHFCLCVVVGCNTRARASGDIGVRGLGAASTRVNSAGRLRRYIVELLKLLSC
jgi:hypothetical protein